LAEPPKQTKQREEGFVDVVAAVVSDEQPLEGCSRAKGALDEAASGAKARAALGRRLAIGFDPAAS
jgi:hypothetical protein